MLLSCSKCFLHCFENAKCDLSFEKRKEKTNKKTTKSTTCRGGDNEPKHAGNYHQGNPARVGHTTGGGGQYCTEGDASRQILLPSSRGRQITGESRAGNHFDSTTKRCHANGDTHSKNSNACRLSDSSTSLSSLSLYRQLENVQCKPVGTSHCHKGL